MYGNVGGGSQSTVAVQGPLSPERFSAALAELQLGIHEVTVGGPLTETQVDELVGRLRGVPSVQRIQIHDMSLPQMQYAALIRQLQGLTAGPRVATVQAIVNGQPASAVILDGTVHSATASEIAAREKEADTEAAEMEVLASRSTTPTASISLTLPTPPAHP